MMLALASGRSPGRQVGERRNTSAAARSTLGNLRASAMFMSSSQAMNCSTRAGT